MNIKCDAQIFSNLSNKRQNKSLLTAFEFYINISMNVKRKKIAYIYDKNVITQCNRLPTMQNRASLVHNLISAYDLLSDGCLTVENSELASEEDLKSFHSTSYVDFLIKADKCEDLDELDDEADEFGLLYDCVLLNNIYQFTRTIAGSSISAAKLLINLQYDIVINWFGGWHHAQRDLAEGFCYVNDIVLAIQTLRKQFNKVLYVDLDVHHGNGVQNAFEHSKNILTLSFHKLAPGFYPGTGQINDIGFGKGKFHSINVPFNEGISDSTYLKLFTQVFNNVVSVFKPNAVVVQCGADILCYDPLGGCNVSMEGMGKCLKQILHLNLPTLILGGGGYNLPNTARYWTYLTSLIVDKTLPNDIPDNCEDFPLYLPSYELHLECGKIKDHNTEDYINGVIRTINEYCSCL